MPEYSSEGLAEAMGGKLPECDPVPQETWKSSRPTGSNADEWHLFLCERLDNRATQPNGLTFCAVQIAEAIEQARSEVREAMADRLSKIADNIRLANMAESLRNRSLATGVGHGI